VTGTMWVFSRAPLVPSTVGGEFRRRGNGKLELPQPRTAGEALRRAAVQETNDFRTESSGAVARLASGAAKRAISPGSSAGCPSGVAPCQRALPACRAKQVRLGEPIGLGVVMAAFLRKTVYIADPWAARRAAINSFIRCRGIVLSWSPWNAQIETCMCSRSIGVSKSDDLKSRDLSSPEWAPFGENRV
jgi:hypothetical protein